MKRAVWERLEEDGDQAIEDAAAELLREGDSVSVFECRTSTELELVAVALSATRMGRQSFHYIAIEPRDLVGIQVIPSPGDTLLPDANGLHRDLDLSGGRARVLVTRLEARGETVKTIKAAALRMTARRLRGAGQPIPESSWLSG